MLYDFYGSISFIMVWTDRAGWQDIGLKLHNVLASVPMKLFGMSIA